MFWLLLLVIFLAYGRSLPVYFSGDDWVVLYGALKGFNLPYIFSFSPGSFAPLINFAFLILYNLFRLNQIYYHIVVLFIHALNCVLLFCIIREISREKRLAFLTTVTFSVFSPYNQIVIWINGLPGLITSVFFLLSLYSYIVYQNKEKYACYFISVLGFIFSLLSKEWAIMVFPLIVCYDIIFHKISRKVIYKYIPFIAILLIHLSAELSLPYAGKKDMIGPHIFSNLFTYLTTFILPSRNISEIPVRALIPLLNNFLPFLVTGVSILIPLLSLTAIMRGSNYIKFYTLWAYIPLFPFLFFTWGTASRYYYIPSMGFIAILIYLFFKIMDSFRHKSWKVIFSICLSIFIIIHVFFLEIRITKFYHRNREIQNIVEQLQNMHPEFPPHSRLFFSGFSYDRKWGYALRTVYREPTLMVYRAFPSDEDIKNAPYPVFIFNYKDGFLQEIFR